MDPKESKIYACGARDKGHIIGLNDKDDDCIVDSDRKIGWPQEEKNSVFAYKFTLTTKHSKRDVRQI